MKSITKLCAVAALSVLFSACHDTDNPKSDDAGNTPTTAPTRTDNAPQFNADNAYRSIETQVAFGPRVPGLPAQKACAAWMETQLRAVCDTVYIQKTTVTGGDGKKLPCINLIGSMNPAASERVLFLTHWDSRPWADQDIKDTDKPIDAADDAASGVAVLLEMARLMKANPLPGAVGIDILFTDVEDYGKTEWGEDSYCLGTQYWAHNPHLPGYRANYGILLDMVGAADAHFPLEQFSQQYAGNVQSAVWQAAENAGYRDFFVKKQGGGITDDHIPVNEIAKIPTIDIINLSDASRTGFAPHWHTHNDNIQIISKNTLKAVGQTLLYFLYNGRLQQS